VRLFLLFLVTPALLMPPGMCVCQFAPCGEASREEVTACAVQRAETTSTSCTCAHASRKQELPCECPDGDERPSRLPGKPWPDCPVVTGTAPDKFTTPSPVLLALDSAPPVAWALETPAVLGGRVSHAPPRIVAPPLFICQCSLVI
jgi:hypothetical protein